ncbi:MAG: BMP family ABC transporter substrate-binding protein, partial [Acidobacteria bacterium]|nr:BMP family ABC transporter substrate-binding protein [Acidobacteriota bacterium]
MRNSKRFAAVALLTTFGLVAAACGDDSSSGGKSDLVAGVAFDTGGRGDGTFNDSAAAGADKAKS